MVLIKVESFVCARNKLTSLKGAPSKHNGDYDCSYNQLNSLQFGPSYVERTFDCAGNQLTSFRFFPQVKGSSHFGNNRFDAESWIEILQIFPEECKYCPIVPNNSSLNETLKGLTDRLQIIKIIKAS